MPTLTTSFTTFANVARSGSVKAWANVANAQTSDDVRSGLASPVSANGNTDYIQATGLTEKLPSGAVITGIKVTVQRRDAGGTTTDSDVRLVVGGAVAGNNKADTSTQWPNDDAEATYGGAADLWGLAPTSTEVNAAGFGVVLSAAIVTSGLGQPGGA